MTLEKCVSTPANTTQTILEKLKEMGFSPSEATGQRHSVPKIKDLSAEQRARDTNAQEARKNQSHYLAESEKTGRPWFQNTKMKRQYSEFVLVTPEMAKELFSANDNPRRRISQSRIDRYARDMSNEAWHDNSQSIALDYNGKMHNGQHRVSALIQNGKPQRLYFTFNTLVDARLDEDTGASRTTTVQIELDLHNNIGCKLPAICRAAMRGISERSGDAFSASDLADFARLYGSTIEWLVRICPSHKSDVMAALLKAVLWYGPERMEPFIKRFSEVLFTGKDDPAKLLHQQAKFVRSNTRTGLYRKTLSAIHHEMTGKNVSKLLERERDIFDWNAGWVVPSKNQ